MLVASTIVLPGWLGVKYPRSTVPEFDSYVRMNIMNDLEAQQPEVVLIGNSNLALGVDEQQFAELVKKRIYTIGIPGSSTALWYLIIKNNIEDSSFKPITLVLFFTDTLLTNPADRVTGAYFPTIDEWATSDDELLIDLSFRKQLSVIEKILISRLPLYGDREKISNSIKNTFEYLLTTTILKCPLSCMQEVFDSLFDYKNMLPELSVKPDNTVSNSFYTWKMLNFRARVRESYLPEIILKCKKNNIKLYIVRMGTRRCLSQADEPLWVRGYFNALQGYLETQGVGYLDLAHDPRIKPEHYFDFVHLSKTGREVFTRILAESLEPVLK